MEIQISGWRFARTAFHEGKALVMEVAREVCQHCPTCAERVKTVQKALSRADAQWRSFHRQGGLYVAVDLPEGVEVGSYLTQVLGRQVSVYA